jgi:NADH:ubiquinone oxidoreductase subunit 5 (subunit L)/multisubunit Na+/H+ antiporter MnhA subunit
MSLLIDVFAPLMAAMILGSLPERVLERRWVLLLLALVPLGVFIDVSLITWGDLPLMFFESPRIFGQYISFKPQPLGLFFAQLAAALAFFVFLFSTDIKQQKFWVWMNVFLSAILGLFLADNLLCLFVFWELASLASFFLISTGANTDQASSKASRVFLVMAVGSLMLLVGILLLGQVTGSLDVAALLSSESVQAMGRSDLSPWIVALIVMGAASKSALFPFSFWLNEAMVAQSPVSALLHSATLVKAGLYVLILVAPTLSIEPLWGQLLLALAIATALYSLVQSLMSSKSKEVLASSTVASMAVVVFLISRGDQGSLSAALAFILAHGFYKCALFLGAGLWSKVAGVDDLRKPASLLSRMPLASTAIVLSLLSMVGLPFLWGADSKELFFASIVGAPTWAFALGTTMLIVAAGPALRLVRPMLAAPQKAPSKKASFLAEFSLVMLALTPLFLSIYSKWSKALIGPAVQMISKAPFSFAIQDPAGALNKWIWTTLITAASFAFLFASAQRKGLATYLANAWDSLLKAFVKLGGLLWNHIVGLSLNRQMSILLMGVMACVVTVWPWSLKTKIGPELPLNFAATTVLLMGCVGAFLLFFAQSKKQKLMAVVFLGLIQSALYLIFAAPDVAMAQIVVELLLLFLLASLMHAFKEPLKKLRHQRSHVAMAVIFGSGLGFLALVAIHSRVAQPISLYYTKNSLDLANAANVVNAIIADFRGLDTLGEITVLVIAALALWQPRVSAK